MTCPKCDGKTTVRDSKADCESVHRERKCLNCGYIFYTEEYEAPNPYRFKELSSLYHQKFIKRKKARRKNEL